MKHPRRTFLHLAAGATALTYLYPGLICAAIAFFVTQSPARADIITEWNQTAVTTLVQAQLPTGAPTRALAMLHAAMFEAVNSIDPQFHPPTRLPSTRRREPRRLRPHRQPPIAYWRRYCPHRHQRWKDGTKC
jgi:hypothetical protein